MTKNVCVSIIIPTYNCEKYIIETLESVSNQSFQDYEVIIIDDCSTDSTVKKIESFIQLKSNFYIYRNTINLGVSETRNYGFSLSTGRYIALLDSDDIWSFDKLEIQLLFMQKNKYKFTFTSYNLVDNNSNYIGKTYITKETVTYNDLLKENYIGCSSVIFTRDISEKYKMLSNYSHEDYAFWLDILSSGVVGYGILKPLLNYRIMGGGRSSNKIHAFFNRYEILKKKENLSSYNLLYYMSNYMIQGMLKYGISIFKKK